MPGLLETQANRPGLSNWRAGIFRACTGPQHCVGLCLQSQNIEAVGVCVIDLSGGGHSALKIKHPQLKVADVISGVFEADGRAPRESEVGKIRSDSANKGSPTGGFRLQVNGCGLPEGLTRISTPHG